MKCYYEELNVERDATEGDIKTAYRKLALKWHPDKNLDRLEEAKERFQLIQQAYEVLSDPQERAWYDNHREQILRGKNSDYEDSCLDVFQYFTVSCFKGYGDDSKGFYAVYREVFEKISAEDAEFMVDEEELENIPKFGDSKSSYEDVVGPFYAYWSAYCTKRTYTWLCPYDIKDIKDRRILREIEKDMKKVVQKAKKERNEEVRNLVSFIRKRDKRVQAYKKVLEERAAFNRQKQEQNRLEQIRRRQQEVQEMRQNSKATRNDDYEEQLKQLEQQYSSEEEYYVEEDDANDEEFDNAEETDQQNERWQGEGEEYIDDFYCVACNKAFKNAKALANHEISKKHRENIEKLKLEMIGEEDLYQQNEGRLCEDGDEAENILNTNKENDDKFIVEGETQEAADNSSNKIKSRKNKKDSRKSKLIGVINSDGDEEGNLSANLTSKLVLSETVDDKDDDIGWDNSNKKAGKKTRNKNKILKNKTKLSEADKNSEEMSAKPESTKPQNVLNLIGAEIEKPEHVCITCKSKFESKNKLFSHLKLTNHGVYIPKAKANDDDLGRFKKGKGKNK